MAKVYKGAVCYAGHDHEAADGRALEGGWHYAVIQDENGNEMPDAGHKLVVDPETGQFYDATDADSSHREKHHQRLVIVAVGGGIGEPQDAESIEATHRHLDDLEQRLGDSGLDPHERDHILTTPAQITGARRWLSTQGGGE
jgi:hypothetical protein